MSETRATRRVLFSIRVTPDEEQLLERAAAVRGMKRSRFVRLCAIGLARQLLDHANRQPTTPERAE